MSAPTSPALFFLGATHHNTPIELRERLALAPAKRSSFEESLRALSGLREYVILNTCNRIEFYGVAEHPEVLDDLREKFRLFQGFTAEQFTPVCQTAWGHQAVAHLIEVASGLNSQMLGETEILGQVKEAYAEAQEHKSVGPALNRLFQKAFQHAKFVRSHTAITEGQISIANVAVDLAHKIFGRLDATQILLVGAGDIGEKTAKAFQSRGAAAPTVTSRTLGKAMELAQSFGGAALPFDHFPQHLADFDIVVCATAAPHAVITEVAVKQAVQRRPDEPLFFIDLALPRDVEPGVTQLENVFVYNLDHLAKIAEENLAARESEVGRARLIIRDKASALWSDLQRHVGS